MKKMTFALACASTLALFADWTNSIGFEAYPLTDGVFTGLSLKEDGGVDGAVTSSYWLYLGADAAGDSSAVKAYGGDNLAAPTGTSKSGTTGDNYLELSTEGGTLWRSLNNLDFVDGEGAVLGEEKAVGDGLYIDTMVQFTPTEDGNEAETADDDKLAIWLDKTTDGDNEVCTLKVKCGSLDSNFNSTPVTCALVPASGTLNIQPGAWYRLTVEAIDDVFADFEESAIPAFKIRVDGVAMKCVGDNPIDSGFLNEYRGDLKAGLADEIDVGKVFPSLVINQPSLADVTLQAVGFKGSGAVDDLVVTDTNPITEPVGPAMIDFTIAAGDFTLDGWALTNDPDSWTPYAAGAQVAEGTEKIYVKITNADGASKIVEKAIGEVNEFDLSAETFGWVEYLGAAVDGAYVIDNAAELDLFLKGFNRDFVTAGTTFKLGADIALTEAWPGIGVYSVNGGTAAFKGVFDGDGKTISNVTFAPGASNNYRGFFNQLEGATVRNLTVDGNGFGATPPSGEYGCALIAGHALGSTIENCTAKGTIASATHNAAGIVIRFRNSAIKNCTNEADITGSYTKLAGIAVLNQNTSGEGTACLLEGCVNKGTITAGAGANSARDGLGGILAYCADGTLTIKNCENKGSLVDNSGSDSKVGQIVGRENAAIKAVEGTNKGLPGILAIGDGKKDGLNYATVAEGVATYVADSAVVAGGEYLVTVNGNAPAITLADGESITFDTALTTLNDSNITAAADAELSSEIDGTKVTYSAAAEAGLEYPDYIDDDDAEKAKYDAWVANVAGEGFDRAGEVASKANKNAYLLNCAPADVAEKTAEFKIPSITIDEDGTVTVADPVGTFNGTVIIKGATTVNGEYNITKPAAGWKASDARFFKAFLQ